MLIDGGFRRGIDVVKALALGARAVMIGRPHLWGVACAGEDGVFWVLELFRREIDRALALGGWDGSPSSIEASFSKARSDASAQTEDRRRLCEPDPNCGFRGARRERLLKKPAIPRSPISPGCAADRRLCP